MHELYFNFIDYYKNHYNSEIDKKNLLHNFQNLKSFNSVRNSFFNIILLSEKIKKIKIYENRQRIILLYFTIIYVFFNKN